MADQVVRRSRLVAGTTIATTTSPYATVAELAAALRIRITAENTPTLQACLDAAAIEINHSIDWLPTAQPLTDPPNPLLNRVNIVRGVEWFKANDAAWGVLGFDETGALRLPKSTFARHAATLIPLKAQWGIG